MYARGPLKTTNVIRGNFKVNKGRPEMMSVSCGKFIHAPDCTVEITVLFIKCY